MHLTPGSIEGQQGMLYIPLRRQKTSADTVTQTTGKAGMDMALVLLLILVITEIGFAAFECTDPEMKKLAVAVKRTPDRFAEVPVLSPGEQYQAMQAFISTMEDEKVRGMFRRQTQGPECFQRFYIMVEGFGYSKAWELFQSLIYEGVAREWCRENGIRIVEGDGSLSS